ncbi:MAG: MFS transporter, partial [Pseudomonadota bacterium]
MHSSSPPETTSGSAGFHWRSPAALLMVMGAAMQLSFAVWWVLVKNFTVDEAGFTGKEIGMLESIREIPGFLAFLVVFILLLMREQTLAFVSLIFLGVGVALTGYFPNALGLFITTFIMSVGFHFYETAAQSLQLQWLPKKEAPAIMGKIIAVAAAAQLFAYGVIFLTWQTFNLSFEIVFLIAGLMTVAVTIGLWMAYPQYKIGVPQRRKIILRKRYWLYYALTFMSGARRQIFTVFAGFLMVEKFGFEVQHIAALFLINGVVNVFLAPAIGRFIMHWGERRALTLEYIGLIGVFVAYAFVNDPVVAGVLYVL